MDDVMKKYVELINLEKSHIFKSPPIIFLCGGEVDIKKTTNHSIRNMFMNILGKSKFETLAPSIKLAEEFKNWHLGYDNLSEFENDIASLSSYIIIILESAGSLTELGLFYANNNLKSKLVVIVREEHFQSDSFIKLGLINPLKEASDESVYVYELPLNDIERITVTQIEEIVGDVNELFNNAPKTSKFNKLDRGHILFLIFQLINLFHALRKIEIKECLSLLGITDVNLASSLYILQSLSFIRCARKSQYDFYITRIDAKDRVKFGYLPQITEEGKEINVDDSEIKIEYMTYIDKNRSIVNRRRKTAIFSKEPEA